MRDLSPQQRRTLTVVACLTVLQGRVPTLRKIAAELGCNRAAAHYRLHYLEKKGLWNSKAWALTTAGLEQTRPLVERQLASLDLRPETRRRLSELPRYERTRGARTLARRIPWDAVAEMRVEGKTDRLIASILHDAVRPYSRALLERVLSAQA